MLRGRCGGPILQGEPDAVYDGAELPNLGPEYDTLRGGWYVPDYNFVKIPFAEADKEEKGKWRACPISEARRVRPILELWRRQKYAGDAHVPPGLLRMSVGIEHVDDVWADLSAALDG